MKINLYHHILSLQCKVELCMLNWQNLLIYIFLFLFSFMETPRKLIAELSIRKLGSSSVLIIINYLKLCNKKFTWCFHKAKQVYCIHHAKVQGTYYIFFFIPISNGSLKYLSTLPYSLSLC